MTLPELLYRMSAMPARILRVPSGALIEGGLADFVLFDPQEAGRSIRLRSMENRTTVP